MSITGQQVPFVGTGVLALSFNKLNNTRPTRHNYPISRNCKTKWKWFQAISSCGWTSSFAFAEEFLLPAVKSICKDFFYHKSYPSCLTCHQKRRHQLMRTAVRKLVKKQLGRSKRKRRGKRFIRCKKFT